MKLLIGKNQISKSNGGQGSPSDVHAHNCQIGLSFDVHNQPFTNAIFERRNLLQNQHWCLFHKCNENRTSASFATMLMETIHMDAVITTMRI